MGRRQEIMELRERLDRALASPDLMNEESVSSLVKDQLLRSSLCDNEGNIANVVEKRTTEVREFLEMLRSASVNEKDAGKGHGALTNDWKVKQDTDGLRVMYRQGPHGTPFHSLLAEGHVDGPMDVCLCVSWESTLYEKWWPQYSIPTFKIIMSSCLKKIRIGEAISLVRVKVPWPVSDREALLHYFEIEYFKEDLIIVLLNTISDTEAIDVSTYGFSRDEIPEAKDIVRVDLVGGFVLQKVSSNRSYFRTIANMDIKLDFVPPSLINFISRQLIGNGYKLYNKAVGTVATSDEDYCQALQGPLYARIRDGLESNNKSRKPLSGLDDAKASHLLENGCVERVNATSSVPDAACVTEIMEEGPEQNPPLKRNQIFNGRPANVIREGHHLIKETSVISPEVELALDVLDRAIAVIRDRGSYNATGTGCSMSNLDHIPSETIGEVRFSHEDDSPEAINTGFVKSRVSVENPRASVDMSTSNPTNRIHQSSSSLTKETLPAFSYEQENLLRTLSSPKDSVEVVATLRQAPVSDRMSKVCDEGSSLHQAKEPHQTEKCAAGIAKRSGHSRKRICCFSLSFS